MELSYMPGKIGVPKESAPGEGRVALVPAHVPALLQAGFAVSIEAGPGSASGYPDDEYLAKAANIVAKRSELLKSSDILLTVRSAAADPASGLDDAKALREGQIL